MQDLSKVILRPATLADADPLEALSARTIRVRYPDIIGAETVVGYIASGAIAAYYRDNVATLMVAELNGVRVGACATKPGRIDLMMVDLDLHRIGIGKRLLDHGEATLFRDSNQIGLDCFRDNDQARRFYAKHGWRDGRLFTDPDSGIEMIELTKDRPASFTV
ncbi:GNAT family N-acetyltransferase [Maricaulis sp.]|uniref:GNAT family N-acetyltransferase n=1 Tax=Maricaulis sp. TaxID=1486257 RepID=UPI002B26B88D|nr:GNAT family N-acetyltransferase [Maricaulis sp.]